MRKLFLPFVALLFTVNLPCSAEGFRRPEKLIEELTMASPLPTTHFNHDFSRAVAGYRSCRSVPVEELAASEARIGGVRLDPRSFSETRENYYDRIEVLDVASGKMQAVEGLPAQPRIKFVTWSPQGKHVCFTHNEADRVELWKMDLTSERPYARRLTTLKLNSIFGTPFIFIDEERVLFKAVPPGPRDFPKPAVATSSIAQEINGEKKTIRTYQDLLASTYDEALYDYSCTSVLMLIGPEGERQVGEAAIYRSLDLSPDGSHLIAVTEHHPYSYVQSHTSFPSRQFILRLADGKEVSVLRDDTLKKDKEKDRDKDTEKKKEPRPSGFSWRPDMPATLYWSESEGGSFEERMRRGGDEEEKDNPEKTFTDKVYQCEAPYDFKNEKQLVLAPEFRLGRIIWCDSRLALFEESSSKQKFRRLVSFVPSDTAAVKKTLFTQSTEVDSLGNFPAYGRPYLVKNSYGRNVLWTDAKRTFIYLQGSDRRDERGFRREFLDKLRLKDGNREQVWMASGQRRESLTAITDFKRIRILERRDAFDMVPDYWELDLRGRKERRITAFENPVPEFSRLVTDTYVSYTRKDGLKCFAHLYLPADYDKERDGRLPVFMWSYPYDYKCFAESEKARPEPYKYTKPAYGSAMIWATQGYAVLDEFTMSIIAADKDSLANDRFLEQLVLSAEAAVDCIVDSLGIGDRDRIGVGGHSYGAFMTANLLAHTKLFRAGVARSGAYNRSLTPFGFQSERRNYWKARKVYEEMSPFNYVDKIKDALLIIHGQMDNNMGTFPVQSERLYQALVFFGGTARYVQLPYESHSYLGRETTLDMLCETGAWLDKYVKNAPPRKGKRTEKESNPDPALQEPL